MEIINISRKRVLGRFLEILEDKITFHEYKTFPEEFIRQKSHTFGNFLCSII